MDWELYERQRATLVFIGVAILSLLFLAFQPSSPVQHIKAFLVSCTLPSQRIFSQFTTAPGSDVPPPVPNVHSELSPQLPAPSDAAVLSEPATAEKLRSVKVLMDENARLSALLQLKRERWPRLVAARVVSRDPQRWFQEALLDKGYEEGVRVDDPVITWVGNREALVGRIVEAGEHTSRVMLIHDTLSSVAGSLSGAVTEDGVVEGTNGQDLLLRYLHRDSQVKIGDLVMTAGLGMFPEGVPIGWVSEIDLDERQLFLQAKLTPALASGPLRQVGVLGKQENER